MTRHNYSFEVLPGETRGSIIAKLRVRIAKTMLAIEGIRVECQNLLATEQVRIIEEVGGWKGLGTSEGIRKASLESALRMLPRENAYVKTCSELAEEEGHLLLLQAQLEGHLDLRREVEFVTRMKVKEVEANSLLSFGEVARDMLKAYLLLNYPEIYHKIIDDLDLTSIAIPKKEKKDEAAHA